MKVLLIARAADHLGGIVNYCGMLKRNMDPDVSYDHFVSGKGPAEKRVLVKLLKHIWDLFRLAFRLARRRYDLVHVNPSMIPVPLLRDYSILLLLLAFGYRGRVLIFFHGWDHPTAGRIRGNNILRAVVSGISRACGHAVVLSRPFKQTLMGMGFNESRVHVVTTMYEPGGHPFRRLGENDTVTILFMARFVVKKGLYIAADVAAKIKKKGHTAVRFIFAGDGPERPDFERYIQEKDIGDICETPGYLRNEEKDRVLAQSHIFLFPTFYPEGCPIVILEAMGAGAAIVSTPVAAIPEVVTPTENGFLYAGTDPNDFASAIQTLLDDRPLLNRIRHANYLKAEQTFQATAACGKIRRIYQDLLTDTSVALASRPALP